MILLHFCAHAHTCVIVLCVQEAVQAEFINATTDILTAIEAMDLVALKVCLLLYLHLRLCLSIVVRLAPSRL